MGKQNSKRTKKSTESVTASLFLLCQSGMQLLWSLYLGCILLILPLYFRDGYRGIGTEKNLFFRNCSIHFGIFIFILLLIYLVLWWLNGEKERFFIREQISVTDIFVGIYGVAVLISYLFSHYKDTALWGTEGWYMGFGTQMILVLLYFGVSRFLRPGNILLYGGLIVSGICFFLGVLNRFQWYPVEMSNKNPLYISTVGNINWFCGYLVTVLCFVVGLSGVKEIKQWQRRVLWVYVLIGIMALFTQGSASGYMTAFVMALVCFYLFARDRFSFAFFLSYLMAGCVAIVILTMMRLIFPGRITLNDTATNFFTTGAFPIFVGFLGVIWIACYFGSRKGSGKKESADNQKNLMMVQKISLAMLLAFGCAVLLFIVLIVVHTLQPDKTSFLPDGLFLFDGDWGSKRGATWQLGIRCFVEENLIGKLVGVGPDSMYRFLYEVGNEKLSSYAYENFGDLTLTNAHCEMLTVMVNLGILGFVGFAGMMVSGIRRLLSHKGVAFACGMALLAYNINNLFSFQQIMGISIAFVFLGIGEGYLRAEKREKKG